MTRPLTTIETELAAAQSDLALHERINTAKARVSQLTKEYEQAKSAHERAEAERAANAAEARFEGFDGIRVADKSKPDDGLLHRRYEIVWRRSTWTAWAGDSIMQEHRVVGFQALDPLVLAYLIEKFPDQIPPAILELGQGDPYEAFNQYFMARRRGYVIGRASK